MHLNHIILFVALVDNNLHVATTAEHARKQDTTVYNAIRVLESLFDAPLLIRGTKDYKDLTPLGTTVYEWGKITVESYKRLNQLRWESKNHVRSANTNSR